MKTRIRKLASLLCMVILLGFQALLQGSWTVPTTERPLDEKTR